MEWLLGLSVVLNIIFALAIAALMYGIVSAQNEAFHNHTEWAKWEQRWYEVQALISQKLDMHISPSGMNTKMKIKPFKKRNT
jgi:hypothetical protein